MLKFTRCMFFAMSLLLIAGAFTRDAVAQTPSEVMGAYGKDAGSDKSTEPKVRLELRQDRRARLKRYVSSSPNGEEVSIGLWRIVAGNVEILLSIRDGQQIKETLVFTKDASGLTAIQHDSARFGQNLKLSMLDTAEVRNVTGSISYMQRIALPDGATAEITLVDVTISDPKEYRVLSRIRLTQIGQVPISFKIPYMSVDVDPSHKYAIIARLAYDDKITRFENRVPTAVLTMGAPKDNVQIMTQMVGADAAATPGK